MIRIDRICVMAKCDRRRAMMVYHRGSEGTIVGYECSVHEAGRGWQGKEANEEWMPKVCPYREAHAVEQPYV